MSSCISLSVFDLRPDVTKATIYFSQMRRVAVSEPLTLFFHLTSLEVIFDNPPHSEARAFMREIDKRPNVSNSCKLLPYFIKLIFSLSLQNTTQYDVSFFDRCLLMPQLIKRSWYVML